MPLAPRPMPCSSLSGEATSITRAKLYKSCWTLHFPSSARLGLVADTQHSISKCPAPSLTIMPGTRSSHTM
jgi:hypothetical protein